MSENKLQFPLTVRTDGEEFVINKEDEPSSPNQFLQEFDGDRGRSKRRRRCGQCGPCQVKENCNKCNFCLRRDVLKQTCIYRKCVYLRSKPKPYLSPQGAPDFNHISSPPSSNKNVNTSANNSDGPNLPCHNEKVSHPNIRNQGSSFSQNTSSSGPHFLSSESLFKPPVPQISHSSHTPVVISSPENVQPAISPYNPPLHNVHNPLPACGISEKIRPALENSSFSSPLSQPYIPNNSFKYDSYLNHYNRPSLNESRTSMSSPCMYHPGFSGPYGASGPIDRGSFGPYVRPPTIPPYLPTNNNMLRHFTSLPQRYPIPQPPRRYGESDGPQFPSGYGYQPTDMQMPIPGIPHHHPFNSYSNISHHQPPQYEQSAACPKNVFGPPAYPSLALGTLRVQERPLGIHNFRCNPFSRPFPWEKHYFHPIKNPSNSDQSRGASSMSSEYECDIISIDDIEMNAYIRSDGCNSIEIELEIPKSPAIKKETKQRWFREPDINSNYKNEKNVPRKITLTGFVTLKQDLGDEGIVQLDIPGNKVTLEESYLDSSLAKYSCNITDLLKFIESEPRNEIESQYEIQCP